MRALPLIIILGLAACGRVVAPSDADFLQIVANRSARPPQSCVPSGTGHGLRAVDSMTLAYGSGATIYINRLATRCAGLESFSTIIVEAQGSAYCRGDRIRALEPGAIIPGPSCRLEDWVPYRSP